MFERMNRKFAIEYKDVAMEMVIENFAQSQTSLNLIIWLPVFNKEYVAWLAVERIKCICPDNLDKNLCSRVNCSKYFYAEGYL